MQKSIKKSHRNSHVKTRPKGFVPTVKDATTLVPGLERLERAIAYMGLASRREAKAMITRGSVKVNGKTVREPGFGIRPESDKITIDGANTPDKESYIVFKSRGVETTATTLGAKDLKSQFPKFARLAPIGRLDKETDGLIILTNDGTLTKALTKEDSTVGKQYQVVVREDVTAEDINRLTNGIILDKVKTKKAIVDRIDKHSFKITLFEGRKHQIRRMCDACRLTIESLTRIKIGHMTIGKMTAGNYKKLTDRDIALLKGADLSVTQE